MCLLVIENVYQQHVLMQLPHRRVSQCDLLEKSLSVDPYNNMEKKQNEANMDVEFELVSF